MAFKAGDRVVIVRADPGSEIRLGTVATVLSPLVPLGNPNNWRTIPPGTPVHELDLPGLNGGRCGYPPSHLELYRPDDREKTTWTAELLRICGVKESA